MAGSVQDDIRKFQLEINSASKNGETLAELIKLQKETSKLRTENEELQKTMGYLASKGQQNTEAYKRMEAQLKYNKKAINDNGTAMKGLQKNLDLNYMSMHQLKKRSLELRSALNATSKAADPEGYAKLENELEQVGSQMDKLKGKTNQTKGLFSGFKEGAKGLLPAFGWAAIIAGAIKLGKKIYDLVDGTYKLRKQVQQLTGLEGNGLTDLTAKLQASANTFNKDVDELAIANNAFAKSMEISQEAANELINKGFIAGADASGEFLDQVKEYGPQFKAAGLSAEESIAIITQSVKDGIFSDKGADTIKEATLRLREMPQSTADALDSIGISSKQMMADLSSGQITVFQAIQKVSNRLGELPPQSTEVGTAIADIFGGAGEDAGLEYIKMLGQAELSMDALIEKGGESAKQNQRLLEANQELSQKWNELLGDGTGVFNKWKVSAQIFISEGIVKLINGFHDLRAWFVDFYNNSAALRGLFAAMGASFKIAFQSAKSSILEVWELVKGVGNTFKAVLSGNFASIDDIWANTWANMKAIAAEGARKSGEAAVDAWNTTINGKIELPVPSSDDSTTNNNGKIELPVPSADDSTTNNNAQKTNSVVQKAQSVSTVRQEIEKVITVKAEEFDTSELDAQIEAAIIKDADFLNRRNEIRKEYNLMSLDEMEQIELSKLQTLNEQKLLTDQEYLQAKAEMEDYFDQIRQEKEDAIRQQKLDEAANYFSAVQTIASSFSDIFSTLQDSELAAVEDKVDKGLISEEEGEKQELAIKKKYADKAFIATAAQIIASTALGIMQGYAQLGPVLGTIMAVITAAAGVIQLDAANQERNRVKSLSVGGYTGSGNKNEEADLVQLHKNEYVIPSEGVDNPNIRPFINLIENQRVAGTIGTMNMPTVGSARVGGYHGVTSGSSGVAIQGDNYVGLANVVNQFGKNVDKLQKGVPAYFGEKQTRDITKQQDIDAKLLKQTSY